MLRGSLVSIQSYTLSSVAAAVAAPWAIRTARSPPALYISPSQLSIPKTMATASNNAATDTQHTPHPPPLVFCGPSGSGKSTLIERLRNLYPSHFGFSISHTTRAPRPKEQHGVNYHYVTREAFAALADAGAFLEHAEFSGNRYGTSFDAVEAVRDAGRTCILDIDAQGVQQLRQRASPSETDERAARVARDARVLFVRPPSLEILEKRLRARGTDDENDIEQRLEMARREIEFAESDAHEGGGVFDKLVTNDDLEVCWEEVRAWVAEGLPDSTEEDK